MFAFLAACSSGCTRTSGDYSDGPCRGAVSAADLVKRKLLLSDLEGADDDEDAAIEGWLRKSSSLRITRWLWQSRFFRLERGPRFLSFYRSQIWQSCRRDGAFDLTCLVGAHVMTQRGGRNVYLVLEFWQTSLQNTSSAEPVELVKLLVPGGVDTARAWERQLLHCIEEQLLEACEQCSVSESAVQRALQILGRVGLAIAEGRASASVNVRNETLQRTPLMLAAQAGHERLCCLLLFADADVDLRDRDGRSASELAAAAGHNKVSTLLVGGAPEPPSLSPAPRQTVLGRLTAHETVSIKAEVGSSLTKLPTPARM